MENFYIKLANTKRFLINVKTNCYLDTNLWNVTLHGSLKSLECKFLILQFDDSLNVDKYTPVIWCILNICEYKMKNTAEKAFSDIDYVAMWYIYILL